MNEWINLRDQKTTHVLNINHNSYYYYQPEGDFLLYMI